MASRRTRVIVGTILWQLAIAVPSARFGLAPAWVRRSAWARALRRSFEGLGPAFIKVGQLMSVRPEQFSEELVAEMSALRDAAPPVPIDEIRAVFRREFQASTGELFASFDEHPIASASIAQVHRATLRDGCVPVCGTPLPAGAAVAVKIVRPGAADAIAEDIEVARRIVARASRRRILRRFDLGALIDEFECSTARELDLRQEGRFADRFAYDFRHDERVEAPRIVWHLTTREILTMEFIEGWRLADIEVARASGVDCHALALHGATAFMRQVLVNGRYHADLHPANLLLTPRNTIAYLDFGIVGYLTPAERASIAQVLAALVYRDADRALRYSAELGVCVPPESAGVVKAGLGRLLDAASRADGTTDFARFGAGFLALLGKHGVEIPGEYGLLVKSLATVEGVARALYPDIDIIQTARPFVTRVLAAGIAEPARLRERVPSAVRAVLRELVR